MQCTQKLLKFAEITQNNAITPFSVIQGHRNRYTWLPLLCLTPPAEGFPWDDLREIFSGYQWMAKVPNAVEILAKIWTAWVGRTNVTDDRPQTDDRDGQATANTETEVNLYLC